ncbi:MAG TPA: S8 family serine peptidase [Anaerolineaceae bacterium]|nr:S8 family serine peptidase [Anaerolineaceae bacterium]
MQKARVLFVLSAVLMLLFSVASPVMADQSDTVRVWVSYRDGGKSEVFKALSSSSSQIHYDFPELGAYVVSLPAAALNGILNNPWVIEVEEDAERYPISAMEGHVTEAALDVVDALGQTVPNGIDMVQARDVWDVNRDGIVDTGAPTGATRTLCIIDSGYYQGHDDLPPATKGGYSQVDADPTKWSTDGFGHGSHVGGTIAAENNDLGVVGVTPGTVNLYIVKFFADDGNATYASNLVDALNRCQAAGANVVSMSLGGSKSSRTEKAAFANAYAAGVLSIAAAGNSGTSAYSYPASYDSVMSVAAIDSGKVVADFSQYNSQVEIAAPGVAVLSTLPYLETNRATVDGVDYAGAHVEFSARGTASGALVAGGLCDSVGAWAGKVVLCERGDISFYDKVINVQSGGGAAAIIYNNVPGDFLGTLGEGYSSSIIGISLSQEAGQYLVANKLERTATVLSQVAQPASGYEAWDGTSMATPHVSAVAALVWSWDPTLTNVEIRNALTASAQDLGAAGRDNYYGYGLVQARAALEYLGYGGTTPVTPTPTPTLTPTPTPTPTLTPTPTPTPTPDPTLTPPPATDSLHVSDLDGSYTIVRNRWNAIVTITIKDNQGESVSGATVSGVWSDGYTGSASCVTGSNGTCEVSAKNLKLTVPSVTFSVSNVTLSGYTYDASANTDPEGDSNGTVIVYTR